MFCDVKHLLNIAKNELYHANGSGNGYDSLNRLTSFARGTLNGTHDTISSPSTTNSWNLDALGNWTSTQGGSQTRTFNSQNQITGISGLTTPTYDNNGNMTQSLSGSPMPRRRRDFRPQSRSDDEPYQPQRYVEKERRRVRVKSASPAVGRQRARCFVITPPRLRRPESRRSSSSHPTRLRPITGSLASRTGSQDQVGNTYTFNAWNQMVTSSVKSEAMTYTADGLLFTDATTVSGHTTTVYQFHSPQGQVLADLTVSGSNRSYNTYVWGLGYVDDLIEQDTGNLGSSRTYVQQDANHNVTALLSSSGVVTNRFVYDPYGTPTELTAGWATVTGGQGFVYGFQGGRYDANIGNYYFRSRWYDPATGTWMSQDPAGYVNGANLYQAMLGAPISSVDPYGMDDTRGWAYTSTPDNPVQSGSADGGGVATQPTQPAPPTNNPSAPTTQRGTGIASGTTQPADPDVAKELQRRLAVLQWYASYAAAAAAQADKSLDTRDPLSVKRDKLAWQTVADILIEMNKVKAAAKNPVPSTQPVPSTPTDYNTTPASLPGEDIGSNGSPESGGAVSSGLAVARSSEPDFDYENMVDWADGSVEALYGKRI